MMIFEEFLETVLQPYVCGTLEQYCTEINILLINFLSYIYIVSCSLVYLAFLSHLAVENIFFFLRKNCEMMSVYE